MKNKAIRDDQGRVLYKVDERYGMLNGGVFYQSTFGNDKVDISPLQRKSFFSVPSCDKSEVSSGSKF